MFPRISALAESIKLSLWFVPALMSAGAAMLAWVALQIDLDLGEIGPVWWLNQGSAQDASNLLAALLGSLITVATLVISITMVVLTLAAGQLGPRLVYSFIGDRRTQAALGLFIATVVYILLIFRLIDSDLSKANVPHFAVTVATVLVLVCLATLLFYVHHLARSIVADTVIGRIGSDLDRAILSGFPAPGQARAGPPPAVSGRPGKFASPNSGYVRSVDYEALTGAAATRGCVIALAIRPGHHVLQGRVTAQVWPATALDGDIRGALGSAIVLGHERTAFQDVEFSLRQLVELALRALSPGINDAFTGMAVIDRLAASLALLMERDDAETLWADEAGTARVSAPAPTFRGLVDLAFNQIRQSAGDNPAVLIRLIDALAALAEAPRQPAQREVLLDHLRRVGETGRETCRVAADRAAIETRLRAALAAAEAAAAD